MMLFFILFLKNVFYNLQPIKYSISNIFSEFITKYKGLPYMRNVYNCDNISKYLNTNEFPQTKTTPFTVLVPKYFLDQIDFEAIINNNIRWDQDQWRISPGTLALSLVLTPFFRSDKRYPLCSVEEIIEFIDSKLVFGKEYPHSYFNDDCLGLLLDRVHEAGCTGLFSMVALQVFAKLKVPFGSIFQVDTTSHVYYGDSKFCEEKNYEGLKVTYGYSKDKRPDKKQVMSGMITNELGIPLYTEILDENTSDTVWLPDAICHFRNLFSEMYSDSIFIADSKLVSKKNFGILFDKANPLSFISRCPEKFCSRVAGKTVDEAYFRNKWEYVGSCCKNEESKKATKYEVQGFEKIVHGNECQLIVFRNIDGDERLVHELKKERENIEEGVKKGFKKPFACEADAKKAIAEFTKKYKNSLFNIEFEIHEESIEKKPRGRPSKGKENLKSLVNSTLNSKALSKIRKK
jgi:transposase